MSELNETTEKYTEEEEYLLMCQKYHIDPYPPTPEEEYEAECNFRNKIPGFMKDFEEFKRSYKEMTADELMNNIGSFGVLSDDLIEYPEFHQFEIDIRCFQDEVALPLWEEKYELEKKENKKK